VKSLRDPQIRLFDEELMIDCFAGGGGTSTGIEWATGRSPDIAINHSAEALAMHSANHPRTRHIRSNIRKVNFRKVCAGRPVGLAWFSPDCTYHSKARGGKPFRHRDRARRIRGLAWEMVRCAKEVRPRVMALENVEEFQDWCPLTRDGRPDPTKRGQTFERFKARLRNLGYSMEFREERACDKGAPTIRKRLFGVFRRDGQPIVWEKPTHGPHGERPYRTAAECIDFSLPVPSIFLTPVEAKAWGQANGCASPKRPLADASLRRVARGVMRYVIDNPKPFIVRYNGDRRDGTNDFRGQALDEPISTLDTANRFGLVEPSLAPFITEHANASTQRNFRSDEPLRTVCAGVKGGHFALVAPILAGVGGRKGQSPETRVDQPFHTVTTKADTVVATANLAPLVLNNSETRRDSVHSAGEPIRTITAAGGRTNQLVTAYLAKHNGGHEATGQTIDRPVDTLVARDNKALVTSLLVSLRGNVADHPNTTQDLRAPVPTLTAGGTHLAEIRVVTVSPDFARQYPRAHLVAAFLLKYFGTKKDGCAIDSPIHTVTTKHRYALVLVTIDGETRAIVDIGMRMLTPRELFLCQGFPPDYKIEISMRVRKRIGRRYRWLDKPLTKGAQVRLCGNSVSPPHSASIVRANYCEAVA